MKKHFRIKEERIALIQLFENLIEYGQSIISDTPHIERVNSRILAKSRIIQMEHIF